MSRCFQRADKRARHCSSNQDWYDCRQRCRARYIFEKCGCWPLYFVPRYLPENFSSILCPGKNVHAILNNFFGVLVPMLHECFDKTQTNETHTPPAIFECQASCLPDCMIRQFQITVETLNADTLPANVTEGIYGVITSSSFAYQLFNEVVTMDSGEFLSQFGGALGLWLGISFGALVHIPIFIARKLLEKCLRRRTKKAVVELSTYKFF